jgi:hypothetical protein
MRADPHFHHNTFNVRVPRGREGFWHIILDLADSEDNFSVADIDRESNVDVHQVRRYVAQLVRGGFLKLDCHERRRNCDVPLYRLVKRQKQAPRLRRDGSPIFSTQTEQVWTAIRALKTFGLAELVYAATTDDVKVTAAFARRYLHRLTVGGYLAVAQPHAGRHRKQIWRLVPKNNTGPKPPVPYRVTVMWDQNLNVEIGDYPIAEEVAI